MKKLLLIFALAGTVSAQEYLLPIGKNVNSRAAKVDLVVGGSWNSTSFSYTPTMGDLQTVITTRLRELADSFTPIPGLEDETYGLHALVSPGPYVVVDFIPININGKWVVPPEVLEVQLKYGEVTFKLDSVTKVELRVRGNGREERFSSDGSGQGSACFIQTVDGFLGLGLVILAKEYVNPYYRASWITEGEVILWENERFVEFNILDGEFLVASVQPPDFLESLRTLEIPAQSQTPVLTISQPRISRIARVGHTTELTISAEGSSSAHLEFAETLGGAWNAVPAYPAPLALKAGSTTFTHTTESHTAFYRLRTVKTEGQ